MFGKASFFQSPDMQTIKCSKLIHSEVILLQLSRLQLASANRVLALTSRDGIL